MAYHFHNKNSIIDFLLGYIKASENIESEAKVEEIVTIVTLHSIFCYN